MIVDAKIGADDALEISGEPVNDVSSIPTPQIVIFYHL